MARTDCASRRASASRRPGLARSCAMLGLEMFERFTDRARRVLVLAQQEARVLGHNFLGTEHLLLGLIRESDGVAAIALAQLGIGLDDVRDRVKDAIGPADLAPTGSPPFTPRAKKVLELSLREALQLGHNYIGTEHILLGLVREGEGVAANVLVGLGADLARVREQVVQILSGQDPSVLAEGQAIRQRPEAPRCGRCEASLLRSARYRTIEVPPGDGEPQRDPMNVIVVYCHHCGAVLSPQIDIGAMLKRPVGEAVYGFVTRRATPFRTRRFPDDLLAPVEMNDVPESARVELVYQDNEVIEGRVGDAEVKLTGRVGSHRGPLKGTWGGLQIEANWRVGDNSDAAGLRPAILTGHFGDDAVKLQAAIRLAPNSLFDEAHIHGHLCEAALQAVMSAADGGLGSTDAVVAEGAVGETPFELFAALSGDLTKAVVRGSVDGFPTSLDASRDEPSGPVKVYGSYTGPPTLLALMVGVVAYFL